MGYRKFDYANANMNSFLYIILTINNRDLEMEISINDTDYFPSQHHDLPHHYDSVDTSSHSTISLGAYQQHRWKEIYDSPDQEFSLSMPISHTTTDSDTQSWTPFSTESIFVTNPISRPSKQVHDCMPESSAGEGTTVVLLTLLP